MKTLSVLTISIIVLVVIILQLLVKIHTLNKKIKYVDDANMWHKLAITDDLTGVYNRNGYNICIDKNRRFIHKEVYGIILFDVDDFKKINDTHGHLEGDSVLRNVAKILLEVFPEPQYNVFRIGGDEFAVLSKGVSEGDIISCLIDLKKQLDISGNISLSKGYSIIHDSPERAFKYADDMLYADKISKKAQSQSTNI